MNESIFLNMLMALFAAYITHAYLAPFRREGSFHKTYNYAAWAVYILFQYLVMVSDARYPLAVLSANIVLTTVIQHISCSGDIRTAVFRSSILYVFWIAVEIVVQGVLVSAGTDGDHFFAIGSMISKMILYVIIEIYIRWCRQDSGVPLPFRYWIELLLVPAASILIIYNAYLVSLQSGMYPYFSLVSVLLILVNCVIFNIYAKLGEHFLIERQNRAYELGINLCIRQAAEREEAFRQTRILRHDLKKRLLALNALLKDHKIREVQKEIETMLEENSLNRHGSAETGNTALDALVNYKHGIALSEGIRMTCRLDVPAELFVNGTDICVILGNLLDNALEAVEKFPNEENKWVKLTVRLVKDVLTIYVENPYTGSIPMDNCGNIRSSKDGDRGIGLLSVRRTAKKYAGDIMIECDNNLFRATVMLCQGEILHGDS